MIKIIVQIIIIIIKVVRNSSLSLKCCSENNHFEIFAQCQEIKPQTFCNVSFVLQYKPLNVTIYS